MTFSSVFHFGMVGFLPLLSPHHTKKPGGKARGFTEFLPRKPFVFGAAVFMIN
jgi:hypothetical protein